jgi:acetophenone carboxylase
MFMIGARMMYSLNPSHAVAGWHTGFAATIVGGINQHGDPVADMLPEINCTGMGGRPGRDGIDVAGAFFATMTDCADVEDSESSRPIVYTFRNFFSNSYGHGKYRGGAGAGFGIMVKNAPWLAIGGFGVGSRFPTTVGIFGGRASPHGIAVGVRGSDLSELMAGGTTRLPRNLAEVYSEDNPEQGARTYYNHGQQPVPYSEGDTVYQAVNGGAGYGDFLDRDPLAVLRDVRDGITSRHTARSLYHVDFDEKTLKVDEAATRVRRDAAREERLRRAKPYAEFVKEWEKLRPPQEILGYYGPYPDPAVRFEGKQ